MSVIRVNKTKNYTVMSNEHLRDKRLSLKAKGLLSVMLSLPDTWDYSISGLVAICKESETAVKSTLGELKSCGYLVVTKKMPNETESGRIEYVYDIFEKAQMGKQEVGKQGVENLGVENLGVENLGVENVRQLSTKQQSTKESNTKKSSTKKETRHKYGEYKNVLLSDTDMEKLQAEFPTDWEERIERLSAYMASTGKSYKNHLATIRNLARRDRDGNKVGVSRETSITSTSRNRDAII
jgi:hypothetical protein